MDAALAWLEPWATRPAGGWPGLDDDWLDGGSPRWHDGGLVRASDEERAALRLGRCALVLRGRWLQERDGRPEGLITRSLPSPAGRRALAPAAVSLMLTLPVMPAARTLQRASAVIAGPSQAAPRRLLRLPHGAPLLVLRQWRYAEGGRPIEARTAFWRADAANVLMELRDRC